MEAAILVLALLFVAFVALGVYAAVKAVGAAKRSVDRTVEQARRAVEDTTLKAKKYTQPGVAGELADMRLSVRTSLRATREALAAGSPEDASLSETAALFKRLSAHGHQLDEDLRRLERDPDRSKVMERLPELRDRTGRVVRHADSLRWAARDRARRFAGEDLDDLGREIEVESGALRHWTATEGAGFGESESAYAGAGADSAESQRTGSGVPAPGAATSRAATSAAAAGAAVAGAAKSGAANSGAAESSASGASGGPSSDGPEAAGVGGLGPEGTDAGARSAGDAGDAGDAGVDGSRPGQGPEPRAITARDPRKRTAHPWTKARRPESTT
ncbi:hypothetical protein ABT112_21820 [Streptomyces sp. NPDC002055]|uniref:hypothetical protein n=1 Tax=Streptomyces sp. NPDC002055 TaxID=3154534 RepID=UPI003333CD6E